MTRRANQAIDVVDLAFHDRIDGREGRSRGSNSRLVRLRGNVGVGRE